MNNTTRRSLMIEQLEDRTVPSVFGFDSRIPLPSSQLRNPVNSLGAEQINPAIGRIYYDSNLSGQIDQEEKGFGTAFLIGPNFAMTAAHCVYQTDANGRPIIDLTQRPERLLIAFGFDGHVVNAGLGRVKRVEISAGWRQSAGTGVAGQFPAESTRYDYALLELDQSVGSASTIGTWFKPVADSSYRASGDKLFSAGYPTDKNGQQVITYGRTQAVDGLGRLVFNGRDTAEFNGTYVFFERDIGEGTAQFPAETPSAYQERIRGYPGTVQQYRNRTGLDITKGQSGSPVWTIDDTWNYGTRYALVGIVSNGIIGANKNQYLPQSDEPVNFVTPITSSVIRDLNTWLGYGPSGGSGGVRGIVNPSPTVTARPLLVASDSLFGTTTATLGDSDAVTGSVFLHSGGYTLLRLPIYNRGLSTSGNVRVRFYASTDDVIDPAVDVPLRDSSTGLEWVEFGPLASMSEGLLARYLTMPEALPSPARYRVGWVIESDADPEADRGVFGATVVIDQEPWLGVPEDNPAFGSGWSIGIPMDLPVGRSSTAFPIRVDDPDHPAGSLQLSAYRYDASTVAWVPAEFVSFGGSGADRTMVVTPPAYMMGGDQYPTIMNILDGSMTLRTWTVLSLHVQDPLGRYDRFTYASFAFRAVPAPPVVVTISGASVPEFRQVGTEAGIVSLSSDEPAAFELVGGAGDTDNKLFAIVDRQLRTTRPLPPGSRTVRVRATPENGPPIEQSFTVTVDDDPTVTLVNRTFTVAGTTDDDTAAFVAGAIDHTLVVNGVVIAVQATDVDEVVFDGGAGADSVTLTSHDSTSIADLWPGTGRLIETDYSATAMAEQVVVYGSSFGTAYLHDSAGADVFVSGLSWALLQGNGYYQGAVGFMVTAAYAHSGTDAAYLNGSEGDDVFVAAPTYAFLQGAGFRAAAVGFDGVTGYANSGSDAVYLNDSAGSDVFSGTPTHAYLTGTGYWNTAVGFDGVTGYASGGWDAAYLTGSAGNDLLSRTSMYAFLTGAGYWNTAVGFDGVIGYGGGGSDEAYFTDSPGDDRFTGMGARATLSGPGYFIGVDGFAGLNVYGTNGGTNRRTVVGEPNYFLEFHGTWV